MNQDPIMQPQPSVAPTRNSLIKPWLWIVLIIVVLGAIFYYLWSNNMIFNQNKSITTGDKINNICAKNSDCKYFDIAGSCLTPESYQQKIDYIKSHPGYSPERGAPVKNPFCYCQQNMCKTKSL